MEDLNDVFKNEVCQEQLTNAQKPCCVQGAGAICSCTTETKAPCKHSCRIVPRYARRMTHDEMRNSRQLDSPNPDISQPGRCIAKSCTSRHSNKDV